MAGPLSGIRVLDFTWVLAGPYSTMILADLGADVIKVERLGQTAEDRGPGPYVQGVSSYFFSINRGKESLAVDLKNPAGKDVILKLAQETDVITENFTPGAMNRLGLGYDALSALNPRLIYASLSGFGQTGPYANRGAMDVIVQAMSGMMSITGEVGRGPVRVGASIGDMGGGLYLTVAIMAAIIERNRSGLGQRLDASMFEAQVALLENAVVRYGATGEVATRLGTRHPLLTPFQAFPTADGYMVVAGVRDWVRFCLILEREDLAFDARYELNSGRTEHHAELEPQLTEAFLKRTTAEWLELLADAALVGPVNTIDRLFEDPQLKYRGALVQSPLAGGRTGTITVAGHPVKYSRTPADSGRPAPDLGEHTGKILHDVLGMSEEQIAALEAQGAVQRYRPEQEQ
ncbi:MAG: CaiB/BaiF CoA-transferase family protein [Chloroflexi bacterium]|nr:CaiB/BaiF CoA-transferase family protein [Chloroflexota bacterium]